MTQTQRTRPGGTEQILFTRGVPAIEALPATLVSQCMQAVLEVPDGASILQYAHNGGDLPLALLGAGHYGVSEEQVLVGNGSLHLQCSVSALLAMPAAV